MSQRTSNSDTRSITTRVIPVAIGTMGVDLRANPGNRPFESLQRLENAQFLDARTVGKRNGHSGGLVTGNGDIASSVYGLTGDWVYGGGAEYDVRTSSYHPRAGQGMGLLDENTLWTGDRLYQRPPANQSHWLGGDPSDRGIVPMYVTSVKHTRARGSAGNSSLASWSSYAATPALLLTFFARYFGEPTDSGLFVTVVDRDTGTTLVEGKAITVSAAASSVAGIAGLTVSTAARMATKGSGTPSTCIRSMAF